MKPAAAAPSTYRIIGGRWDPWLAVAVLGVLPLLLVTRGAAMGEPFADDFFFLNFSVLRGNPSWLNGGGADNYWRPLSRQAW
jgi:hypothetical protein